MMIKQHGAVRFTISVLAVLTTIASSDGFEIDWHTIDGGGTMLSTGGNFRLSGTVGQPDAVQAMTSGGFELTGGFWAVAPVECACLADLTGDAVINGDDIQLFVDCLLGANGNCDCANVDGLNGVDMDDLVDFVDALLSGVTCP